MKYSDVTVAYIFVLLHTLLTGLSFLFSKTSLMYTSPIHVLSFRFTASFLALLIPILFKKVHLNYRGKDLRKVLILSLIYPIAFFGFQTFGLVHASSSEAGIIQASTPIFTMILSSIILKEKTTSGQKFSILMSVIGVVYIFIMKGAGFDFTKGLGLIFLVISILSMSLYLILAREISKQFSVIEISFMMSLMGFIFVNTASIAEHLLKGNIHQYFEPLKHTQFVISVLYLGILAFLITSLLNNYALRRLEASKISVFGNLRTVVTVFSGIIFLKEKLYLYHIIGSLIIIAGVTGANYTKSKQKKESLQKVQ